MLDAAFLGPLDVGHRGEGGGHYAQGRSGEVQEGVEGGQLARYVDLSKESA